MPLKPFCRKRVHLKFKEGGTQDTMKAQESGRIGYLDTARAYLIVLVVVGHILIVLNPVYDRMLLSAAQEWIAAFHMPAFFVIHGILLRRKLQNQSWGVILQKRLRTMVVPYVFFEVLGILCRRVVYGQSLMTGLSHLITLRCNVGADWFLPALLMGNLAAVWYLKRENPTVGWVSVAGAVLLTMLLPKCHMTTVLGRGLMGYCFIMAGVLLPEPVFVPERKRASRLVIYFVLTVICAVFNLKFGGNDFYNARIGNPVTLMVGGICGTGLVLMLAQMWDSDLFRQIGRETLTIMGTHQLVLYAMTAAIPQMAGGSVVWGVVLAAGVAGFELLVILTANRWFFRGIGRFRERR